MVQLWTFSSPLFVSFSPEVRKPRGLFVSFEHTGNGAYVDYAPPEINGFLKVLGFSGQGFRQKQRLNKTLRVSNPLPRYAERRAVVGRGADNG